MGYAFVALSTPSEAERAIAELNGKAILERKVSIQLARTPEAHAEGSGSGAEGASGGEHRRRTSTRGRGRGRGRGGRTGRGGRSVRQHIATNMGTIANTSQQKTEAGEGAEHAEGEAAAPAAEPAPTLTETTNDATAEKAAEGTAGKKPHVPRERKQRGPPEDGVPSKTKVMVANLPYDLKEDRVSHSGHSFVLRTYAYTLPAHGDLRRLPACFRQNRPPPHPSFHGQEAPSPQRASQGPRFRLRHSRFGGASTKGMR